MVSDQRDRPAAPSPEGQEPHRRRQLATVVDVARLAGVSTATVDRVLNQRQGVRPVTVERVLKAAAEIGYVLDAALPAGALKPLRLAFLLPAGSNRFLTGLGRLVVESRDRLASFNIRPRLDHIDGFNPDLLAQALRSIGREVDGIAFMAIEHPTVREAVDWLADRGVPTVDADLRHRQHPARRLCRAGQSRGGPDRGPARRALHRPAPGQGGDDRRQPELSRS